MLVSHTKEFIFLKTVKTAGTSIEGFLERYCLPEDDFELQHFRPETVTQNGIIGARGFFDRNKMTYYNHMPASKVRSLLGEDIWSKYTKLTAIRNPYDKVISNFFFNRYLNIDVDPNTQELAEIKSWFEAYVRNGNLGVDRNVYTIEGEIVADRIIRYENLYQDLEDLSDFLKLEFNASMLPDFKREYRRRDVQITELITPEIAKTIEKAYEFEFRVFGYPKMFQ